jgi:hypothetical protein
MTDTPHLALPLLAADQAQKHVTHNEALTRLDAVVQLSVKSRSASVPPGAPQEGDRYIVGTGGSAAWAGWDGKVALRADGEWWLVEPAAGWLAWVEDEAALFALAPTGWAKTSTVGNFLTDFAVNLYADSGRFAGNTVAGVSVGAFVEPAYLSKTNSTTVASAGKFITNNNDYGGAAGSLSATVRNLIDRIRGAASRRFGLEFYVAEYTMGVGTTGSSINIAGTNYYGSLLPTLGAMVPRMTFHAYVRAIDAPIVWAALPGQTLIRDGVPSTANQLIAPADGWVSMTVWQQVNPYDSVGYQPNLFQINAAASGHRYQVACAAAMPGITAVDDNVGVIAGINRWLV